MNSNTSARSSSLFQPVRFGALSLRNRIAMAPMTREKSPGGVPTDEVVEYYRKRAAGGVGLIISEGVGVEEAGIPGPDVPRMFGDEALAGWQKVVNAVHAEGGAIIPQLWHVGAFDASLIGVNDGRPAGPVRISPSGLAAPGTSFGRAMEPADIRTTVDAFARAAAVAQSLGFDGIELHGAHGYLFDQFFWNGTNQRSDKYGPAEYTRFAVDVISEIRRRTGPDFPIILRISQWKQLNYDAVLFANPRELEDFLKPLVNAGVDIFHASTRRFWDTAFDNEHTLAGWVRKLSGKPSIIVGSVTMGNDFKSSGGKNFAEIDIKTIEQLEKMLAADEFDLVAIGRALLANPDWVNLVAAGRLSELKSFSRGVLDHL